MLRARRKWTAQQEGVVPLPLPLLCSVQTRPARVSLLGARVHSPPGWASGPMGGGLSKSSQPAFLTSGKWRPVPTGPTPESLRGIKGALGGEAGLCGVLTALEGVGCRPRP